MPNPVTDQVTDKVELTPEQQDQEAAAALSAGYNKVNPPETPPEKVDEKADEVKAGAKPEVKEDIPDPWAGVPLVVRQALEGITGKLGTLDTLAHEVKSTTGRIGAIQRELAIAAKAAAKVTENAPTQTQIADATKNPEKWTKLKEDYPEWADALDERFAAERAETLKQVKAPDVDSIKRDVTGTFAEAIRQSEARAEQRARALARIDAKHENWEDTIKTPAFVTWAYTEGPTLEERQQQAHLERTAPDKAAVMLGDLVKRYPKWWTERGALMDSVNPADSIRLLDAFADHKTAEADRAKKDKRLAGVIAPQQATRSGPSILPDEAGLSVGYNRMKRA